MSPIEDFVYELDLSDPSDELLEYARENLNESIDTKKKFLDDFRNYIENCNDCKPHRKDDAFLLRFLRKCNFQLPDAQKLLVNYCKFKNDNSKLYTNLHMNVMHDVAMSDVVSISPYTDQNGRRILLGKLGNWDPKKYSVEQMVQTLILAFELLTLEQSNQIMGINAIFDFDGFTLRQAVKFSPGVAMKCIQIVHTSFPLKLHAIHIVNQPWVFNVLYKVFYAFVEESLLKKIFFHGKSLESLHKHVATNDLPAKYGGKVPNYSNDDWRTFIDSSKPIEHELNGIGCQFSKQD